MQKPLERLRLLEFGNGITAADLTRILADFGAQVIHVESLYRPGGMRDRTRERVNSSWDYVKAGRNKMSLSINLKTGKGKEVLRQLVRRSDVVVENWSAGVMENWGLDYDRLREIKPDIIVISLSGLGHTGPWKDHVFWGSTAQAFSGISYMWNHANQSKPVSTQIFYPDEFTSVQAACVVLAAINYRKRTGKGQYIDVASAEMATNILGISQLDYTINGRVAQPIGNRSSYAAPHGAYRCTGNTWCVIAIFTNEEWHSFCDVIGNPQWTKEERFATVAERLKNVDELDKLVGEWTSHYSPWEVMEKLQRAGVAAGVVSSMEDLCVKDAHIKERGFLVKIGQPMIGEVTCEGIQTRLSKTPGSIHHAAPLLGEHTRYICKEILGMSEEEIDRLVEEDILV